MFFVDFFSFKVVILLDTTPDQSMLDEGIAREIVNRIQRLRKKVQKAHSFSYSVFILC